MLMNRIGIYDVVIVGGGLAGLSAGIVLARKQYNVLIIEKDDYPRHKVCGEYISLESKPFLKSLGLPIDDLRLPVINKLQVTDCKGRDVNTALPQGGFGISRYLLDAALSKLAIASGATLLTHTKVDDVQWQDSAFVVKAGDQNFPAKVVCGSWGKRSNMDVKWQRPFLKEKNNSLNNYLGIKYHIRYPWPADCVGLHNFSNGYCGISPIEDGKLCLCYLTTAANLKRCGSDIKRMEHEILMQNPILRKIFTEAEFLYEVPLAISQISFQKKELIHNHVILLGDAAGMITPLCGNGMSMALHSAKLSTHYIDLFLQCKITQNDLEVGYTNEWQKHFSTRIAVGRFVQSYFGKNSLTSLFIRAIKLLPFLQKHLVSATSGRPY